MGTQNETNYRAMFEALADGREMIVTALRYARDTLKVKLVHTDHNTMNQPIIALDRKFGYVEMPGTFVMKKVLV